MSGAVPELWILQAKGNPPGQRKRQQQCQWVNNDPAKAAGCLSWLQQSVRRAQERRGVVFLFYNLSDDATIWLQPWPAAPALVGKRWLFLHGRQGRSRWRSRLHHGITKCEKSHLGGVVNDINALTVWEPFQFQNRLPLWDEHAVGARYGVMRGGGLLFRNPLSLSPCMPHFSPLEVFSPIYYSLFNSLPSSVVSCSSKIGFTRALDRHFSSDKFSFGLSWPSFLSFFLFSFCFLFLFPSLFSSFLL